MSNTVPHAAGELVRVERKCDECKPFLDAALNSARRMDSTQGQSNNMTFERTFRGNLESAMKNGLTSEDFCKWLVDNFPGMFRAVGNYVKIWNTLKPEGGSVTLEYYFEVRDKYLNGAEAKPAIDGIVSGVSGDVEEAVSA